MSGCEVGLITLCPAALLSYPVQPARRLGGQEVWDLKQKARHNYGLGPSAGISLTHMHPFIEGVVGVGGVCARVCVQSNTVLFI